MSSHHLPKLTRYVPLWKQRIPWYPVYFKGNPQFRIFLPLFWMKLVKSPAALPTDTLKFEVHPQMTTFDVKNYLEKIYSMPVLTVRTEYERGKPRKHPTEGCKIQPEDDKCWAFVQLREDVKFVFPELFKEKKTTESTNIEQMKKAASEHSQQERKQWGAADVPQWFR